MQGVLSGMDIVQVRTLARQMRVDAREIEVLADRMTALIEGLPWKGGDRDRFMNEWRSRHASALRRAAGGLADASRQAHDHANRQEQASRA